MDVALDELSSRSGSRPEPRLDSRDDRLTTDQLDALADEIATFATRIDIATHALLARIRIFDAHEAWGTSGAKSCAHWLAWRTGISPVAAREKVRVARELGNLPELDARFARGELSYSKVRALSRVATPQTEHELISIADHATGSQTELICRAYARVKSDPHEPTVDQRRFVRRSDTRGGMVRIEIQLAPEEAALVWDAIESAMDGARAPARHCGEAAPQTASAEASANQAPGASAEAPANHQSPTAAHPPTDAGELSARRADAIVDFARAYLHHRPRTLGSGYDLVLFTSAAQLQTAPTGIGGHLRDGTPIPIHIARMLACDGARVGVITSDDGNLLDIGRRTRSIPTAIGRALWLRDKGCVVPGCTQQHHVQAHHIQPWYEGGPTSVDNLLLLCSAHHTMLHDGTLKLELRDGEPVFRNRYDLEVRRIPPTAATGHDLEELELYLDRAGIDLDPILRYPKWDGSRMELGEALSWILMGEGAS